MLPSAAELRDGPGMPPAGVTVPRGFFEILEEYDRPKILDFGCGYGRSTVELIAAGYDVWGVDISAEEIEKARTALRARQLDPARVSALDADGRSIFPDASFDVVFSDQVLEHVANLELAVAEIARLLRPEGITVHQWPARWRPIEGHLCMPCVHWLPKNSLRRAAIHFWTLMGVRWPWPPELDPSAGRRALAEFGYRYSVNSTFYRPAREIERAFQRHGLEIGPTRHPRIEGLPRWLRRPALHTVHTFRSIVLVARKPGRV